MTYNFMTAAEAASLIKDGEIIALSGFTPAGSPKAVTAELARQAEENTPGRTLSGRYYYGSFYRRFLRRSTHSCSCYSLPCSIYHEY